MKIQPVSLSEVFDIYSSVMHSFIEKKGSKADMAVGAFGDFAKYIDDALGFATVATKVTLKNTAEFHSMFEDLFKVNLKSLDEQFRILAKATKEAAGDGWDDIAYLQRSSEELGKFKQLLEKARESIDFAESTPEAAVAVEKYLAIRINNGIPGVTTGLDSRIAELTTAAARTDVPPVKVPDAPTVKPDAPEVPPVKPEAPAAKPEAPEVSPTKPNPADATLKAEAPAVEDLTTAIVNSGGAVTPEVTKLADDLNTSSQQLGVLEEAVVVLEGSVREVKGTLSTMTDEVRAIAERNIAAAEEIAGSMRFGLGELKQELVGQIEAVAKTSAGNQEAIKKLCKQFADSGRKAGKKAVKASDLPETWLQAIRRGNLQWLQKLMGEGTVAGLAIKGITYAAVGAILLAVYFNWDNIWAYISGDADKLAAYQEAINRLHKAIIASTAKHKALRFVAASPGETHNQHMVDELGDNQRSASVLYNLSESTDEEKDEAMVQLSELKTETTNFMRSSDDIAEHLSAANHWEDTLAADQELLAALGSAKEQFRALINAGGGESISGGQGVGAGAGTEGGVQQGTKPVASPRIGEGVEGERTILDVYGVPIDITDTPAGFRSTAFRMVKRLLNHPVGKAFVDPDNQWGGFIRKTGRPEVDYLNSLGYLYKEGVHTPSQLRKFMRHAIPKQGRRRHSGWKNAVKYYRRRGRSRRAENLVIYTDLIKRSTNRSTIGVKMANEYPNKYISDAIVGLSDQYAKSYFAGLKSQYNTKADKSKADYRDLYELHGEKGADLVQEAHPEAIVVADAMGNGGLVENSLEQKSHSEGVAKSAPTGNFRGKHANLEVIMALTKIANQADKAGFFEVSELIDTTINNILDK